MSRINLPNMSSEGHRIQAIVNRDLQQKLTYQQLLNLNHDLSKQNQQLKNIANRLGQQLRNLHTQFEIRPRDQNGELYNAIGSHPILHQYELTLIPLLDAYQSKIQEFESGFQTINQEFIYLQKKYQEAMGENEKLRAMLTEKTTQLIDLYKKGSTDKLGADFHQLVLQQTNEKQKWLAQENSRLDAEYQRHRSEAEKHRKDSEQLRKRQHDHKQLIKDLELSKHQLQGQLKALKDKSFELQISNQEQENQKRKMQKDLQRAQSQITQLNKERESVIRNYDSLREQYEQDVRAAGAVNDKQNRGNRDRQVFQDEKPVDDSHKKLTKLQKEYEALVKDKNKLKETVEQQRITVQDGEQRIAELKKDIGKLENEKRDLEMRETKHKKLAEQIGDKLKNQVDSLKNQHQNQVQKVEEEMYKKLQQKQKQMRQADQKIDQLKLQKEKLEQQVLIYSSTNQKEPGSNRQGARAVEKLKEKMKINEDLFRQQMEILQNDNSYLKRENDQAKSQAKSRDDEIKRLKIETDRVSKEYQKAVQQKNFIIEEIKRVRGQYAGDLRDKQKLFDQKIMEIKVLIEDSDKKRKLQREKFAETAREYKRLLEQIKNTYEERITYVEEHNVKVKH